MPANVHTPAESSSHPHYDSSTGKWDGQLPVAGILSQVPENWPSLIERDSFVDLAAVTLNLSACQTATFRRICFRAGSASQGCWESQDNIARYLGYKRRAVVKGVDKTYQWGGAKVYHRSDDCQQQIGRSGDVTGVGRGSIDGALCVFRLLWSLRGGVLPAALEAVALAVQLQDVDVVRCSRSSSAPVSRSEPKTSVHSSKGRLVVTMMEPRS